MAGHDLKTKGSRGWLE